MRTEVKTLVSVLVLEVELKLSIDVITETASWLLHFFNQHFNWMQCIVKCLWRLSQLNE
jgi:hypothetical protein